MYFKKIHIFVKERNGISSDKDKMNEKTTYWLELSDYDLETARAMLKTKRFLYVGFMCHQAIEKILKAYWSKISTETPPFTHNLTRLAEQTDLFKMLTDAQLDLIDSLEPLNIEARYPSYKERLLQSLNQKRSEELITRTQELQQWIKQKL